MVTARLNHEGVLFGIFEQTRFQLPPSGAAFTGD
jgi:hypothetical protein